MDVACSWKRLGLHTHHHAPVSGACSPVPTPSDGPAAHRPVSGGWVSPPELRRPRAGALGCWSSGETLPPPATVIFPFPLPWRAPAKSNHGVPTLGLARPPSLATRDAKAPAGIPTAWLPFLPPAGQQSIVAGVEGERASSPKP